MTSEQFGRHDKRTFTRNKISLFTFIVICWIASFVILTEIVGRHFYGEGAGRSWVAFTLTQGCLLAVSVSAAANLLRKDPDPTARRAHFTWIPLALVTILWFFGGLITLAIFLLDRYDACAGAGGLSTPGCIYKTGPIFFAAGSLSAFLNCGVLVGAFYASRRSAASVWLAPAVIVGLYVLSWLLWAPHRGFGITPQLPG